MSKIPQDVLQIFQNQNICMKFKQEVSKIGHYVKNFQLQESHRFHDFKDTLPLLLTLFVAYHPSVDFKMHLPKEKSFVCFEGTSLENVPIRIAGETIQTN
jgi:hypothetical protein